MPVRELRCETESCSNYGITYEWFAKSMHTPDPKCPACGVHMERQISRFATPFIGTLDRFKSPNMERCNEYGDGHWAWRNKSTRNPDGTPERVLIRTHSEQREYCKAEGLVMPDEISSNSYISSDGKTLLEGNTWRLPDPKPDNSGTPWLYTEE